jgi:hypothetical protein
MHWNEWDNPLIARYTSGDEGSYFGWTDAAHTTPSGLARRFVERFPEIVAAGNGSDWLYAGWYVEMLHLTYPDALPFAIADWEMPDGYIPTTSPVPNQPEVQIPFPPPGEAAPQGDRL